MIVQTPLDRHCKYGIKYSAVTAPKLAVRAAGSTLQGGADDPECSPFDLDSSFLDSSSTVTRCQTGQDFTRKGRVDDVGSRLVFWWFVGPLCILAWIWQTINFGKLNQSLWLHWFTLLLLLVCLWKIRPRNLSPRAMALIDLARMYVTLTAMFASLNFSLYRYDESTFLVNPDIQLDEIQDNVENKLGAYLLHHRLLISAKRLLADNSLIQELVDSEQSVVNIGEDKVVFKIRIEAFEEPNCLPNAPGSCAAMEGLARAAAGTWLDSSSVVFGTLPSFRMSPKTESVGISDMEEQLPLLLDHSLGQMRNVQLQTDSRNEIAFRTFWFESALFLSGNARSLVHPKSNSSLWIQVAQGFALILILGVYLNELIRQNSDE